MRAMPWACGGVRVPLWRVFSPGLGPEPPERGRGRRINGVKADENVFWGFFLLYYLYRCSRFTGEASKLSLLKTPFPFTDSSDSVCL